MLLKRYEKCGTFTVQVTTYKVLILFGAGDLKVHLKANEPAFNNTFLLLQMPQRNNMAGCRDVKI